MARIAIITGAASGIGPALARALVLRSDTVVVADIDGDGAERVADEVARLGPGAARPRPLMSATPPRLRPWCAALTTATAAST